MISTSEPEAGIDSAELLRRRLDDPATAQALNELLDHVDLLAVLVTGLNGLVSRGDTIIESLAGGVHELKGAVPGAGLPDAETLGRLTQGLIQMVGPLSEILPTLQRLTTSGLADPRVIDIVSVGAQAVVEGSARAQSEPPKIYGLRGLLRLLKDEDINRSVGFLAAVAKSFGQHLRDLDPPSQQ